ncbi:hypothetical protein MUP95_07520 [bacterium]|nr:hypothetical protein [bacterium]
MTSKENKQVNPFILYLQMIFLSYHFLFLFLFILQMAIIDSVYGGFEDFSFGGRAASMGSAYVAVANGPETIFFNPAGLSQSNKTSLSFFSSRLYGLKELTVEALSSIFPTRYGRLGLTIQTFGNALYRENTFAFGWGYPFSNTIHLGILIRTVQLQIEKYGSEIALAIGGGCLLQFTDQLIWGISAMNINQARIGKQKDPIPRITRLGISYRATKNTLLSLEVDKDSRVPLEMKGGLEICPVPELSLRCGFGRDPSYVSAGIGVLWNIFSCDYGLSIHPILGITHHGSLTISSKIKP